MFEIYLNRKVCRDLQAIDGLSCDLVVLLISIRNILIERKKQNRHTWQWILNPF